MDATLILNPASGDSVPNAEKAPHIQEALAAGGMPTNLVYTSEEKSAADLAREAVARGAECVIVGGGDGTVSLVAAELAGNKAKFGVLPLGTYNNIATSIGMPADLDEACAILARGRTRQIDVGQKDGGGLFFEAAGAGLDAELFPIGHAIKEKRWANFATALRQMVTYEEKAFTLTFDRTVGEAISTLHPHRYRRLVLGEKHLRVKGLFVVVANGPYYGSNLSIAPEAKLDDGLLTVCVYRRFTKWELMRHFWGIAGGKYRYSPKVMNFHVREVNLESAEPLPVHGDGEVIGETPVQFRSVEKALTVLSP